MEILSSGHLELRRRQREHMAADFRGQPANADAGRHGETHGHVICGRDELRLSRAANTDCAENSVANVARMHAAAPVEM